MSRFREPPDPLFQRLNSSAGFDWRLAPYDIRQSRAHARMLEGMGVLDAGELETILGGLDTIAGEFEADRFVFTPDDEDVHMAVERRLTELVGDPGRKLHTARSRNDQVATDVAMFCRDHADRVLEAIGGLAQRLVDLAEAHIDWPLPGYTHLQRAQPVYLSHHLLAYVWMLLRDAERFRAAKASAGQMPLGVGALAGVNWDNDRRTVAAELGFDGVTPNSIDSTASRDYVLDWLSAAATCATHLSRLGSELVLWSSSEFGFCEVGDAFTSGSSIMPQKKNPDAAELLRAKAPRIVSHLMGLQGVFHGLPLTYNKDMQEDKEGLFDAADTLELCLATADGMLADTRFDRERMAAAASDEMIAATDIADLLVRRGMAFRDAHGVVGGLVRHAVDRGVTLSELSLEEMRGFSELLDDEVYEVLAESGWLESKVSEGGTALPRVREQLDAARRELAGLR
ncbi:MAG: argininosuccinate lyase [Solirubrobacterales bacterium]